jgi:hypothetical protein
MDANSAVYASETIKNFKIKRNTALDIRYVIMLQHNLKY